MIQIGSRPVFGAHYANKFWGISIMQTVRTLLIPLVLLFIAVGLAWAQRPENVKTFMRAKLDHSQKVLEGLTTENFDQIKKHAAQMEVLSQEAAWQVLQTAEYQQQSLEFRRATKALKEAAEKKNLDAAALAYVDVTMKCVKCHKYVRNVRNASVPDEL